MQKEPQHDDNEAIAPSKTQRKKDMHDLQAIGEQLVELDPKKLAEFDLPEILVDAIKLARPMQKHGARRRQLQYIGRLMREVDASPIQEKLDSWQQNSKQQTARLHQLERWRERLLSDEHALTEFAKQYPQADLQRLRLLIRNAQKEKAAEKPPKSFRLLFQELQGIVEV
ncbi:ribosome biogenesis factor YjgA [Nitrosomonas sp. sh817]|uniref:ribosome biogenesis factor YjgA n=1 Tax=unclassified Nitrosomonas TaxID=2609265 RepID=UPI0027DB0BB6|nr:ribosome biogenesis factor YjgA [Nitrosomonas sp. sh817]WMJ08288.1 ribosome biogenesis factor YjgA [Nitrosomonas sp. sh817]